jgi:hypothetical protein
VSATRVLEKCVALLEGAQHGHARRLVCHAVAPCERAERASDRGRLESLFGSPRGDDLRLPVSAEDEQGESGAVAADRAGSVRRAGVDDGRGIGSRAFEIGRDEAAAHHRDRPPPAIGRSRPPAGLVLVGGTEVSHAQVFVTPPAISATSPAAHDAPAMPASRKSSRSSGAAMAACRSSCSDTAQASFTSQSTGASIAIWS